MFLVGFILLVLLEVEVIGQVWESVGLFFTLVLLLAMGVLGMNLTRREGIRTLMELVRKEGVAANLELLQAGLLLAAGFLFLFPGFLTDFLAILLLVPPIRLWAARFLLSSGHFRSHGGGSYPPPREVIIEGDYQREARAADPEKGLPDPEKE